MNTNIQILVVEDFKGMRKVLVGILKTIGFKKICEAENGKRAWDMIQTNHYDLVLTDLMMPEMDGMELLEQIRTSDNQIKDTPVVMLTASYQETDIALASKWKVNGYITKPFSVKTVLSKIKELTR